MVFASRRRARRSLCELAHVAPRALVEEFDGAHLRQIKTRKLARVRRDDERVRHDGRLRRVGLIASLLDREDRADGGAARGGRDGDVRALQLSEHPCETSARRPTRSRGDGERDVGHACRRRRAGVVTDSADATLPEVEHDH